MGEKLLRLNEIAARTGISIETLRWYRKQGKGPRTWRLGRRVVAYERDVEAWIDTQAAAEEAQSA
jgi:predicted DNA-binding transcriptional regulator AlpA